MKKFCLFLVVALSLGPVFAQTAREEIYEDVHRSAANYYAYPDPVGVKYTTAPKGYKPFYISHYARHGSRWLIGKKEYSGPAETMRKAYEAGALTAKGVEVMHVLDSLDHMSKGRLGELTSLGARQHRGIAKRMYENFPEVFAGNAPIDARSTVVIRCILSMMAECLQLQTMNPDLQIKNDASYHDMYYMNYEHDDNISKYRKSEEAQKVRTDWWNKTIQPDRFISMLFSDTAYVSQNINKGGLMWNIFDIAANMQSLDTDLDLYPLFTKEECYAIWTNKNLSWYHNYGPSKLTQGKLPYFEANLLKNIVETADSCIKLNKPGATLRFGHEVVVYPLTCLMELGDYGTTEEDPAKLDEKWRNYKIFPMASNVQLVFYRKKGSNDILVKVMLNEHEMSLPVKSDMAPYYHWSDVSDYYKDKLSKMSF